MARLRDGLLMVRPISTDPDAPNCPALPSGWSAREEDAGWCSLYRDSDGLLLASWLANTNAAGDRGLFLVLGDRAVLDNIAAASDYAAPLRTVWQAALDGNATAQTVLARWPVWRIHGFVRDPETGDAVAVSARRQRLFPRFSGLAIPLGDPLPHRFREDGTITTVQAEATVQVGSSGDALTDGYVRPALDATVAGWADGQTAESTT